MINSRDLKELHPCLQRAATEFLERCTAQGLNVLITQTYRDNEYQNALYDQGRIKPGNIVTNCKGGQSLHNYRLAFDICKNVKGQEYSDNSFFERAGQIWEDMGGTWGGSWSKLVDRPHMEFSGGLTISQLQSGKQLQDVKMKWEQNVPIAAPVLAYKISESNLTIMVEAGVMCSPEYWRNQNVQYLNELLLNAAKKGVLDKRIDNGIYDVSIAIDVLRDAGITMTPNYWKNLVNANTVNHLSDLLINLSNKCRIVLEKIVQAEAQSEGLEGQIYVAKVILNRSNNSAFPNGIYNVVFEKHIKDGKLTYQFQPVANGTYAKAIPALSVKQAVDKALLSTDNSKGAIYFCTKTAASKIDCWHENNLKFLFEHGSHRFYK